MRIRGTVFEHLQDAAESEANIDRDALQGLFSQKKEPPGTRAGRTKGSSGSSASSGSTPGGGEGSSGANAKKPSFVALLDLKRGSNVEIMLSQMRPDLASIADAVRRMDETALTPDEALSMLRFLPTSDEAALLRGYEGDPERLGKAERYFTHLIAVAGYESKLRALVFKQGFEASVRDVRAWTSAIARFCGEMKASTRVGRLVALVLNLGNALNNQRGPARGFALSSLPKLLDTRSFDGKTTLLHYLVAHLERKERDLLTFAGDAPHLKRATRLTFAAVEEEMAPLNVGLDALRTELDAAEARVRAFDAKIKARKDEETQRRAAFAAKMARASPRDVLDDILDDEDEEAAKKAFAESKKHAEEEERRKAEEMADARDAKHEREFREALFAFHHDAKRQLEQCASKAEEAKEAFKDLARYFGEDVAKISFAQEPERFAGVVKDFADLIEKAQKERAKVEAANKDEEQGAREEKVNDAKKPNATPKEKETRAKTREKASEEKPAAAKKKPAINVQDVFDDIKRGAGMASLRKTEGGDRAGEAREPFWKREGREKREKAEAEEKARRGEGGGDDPPKPPPPPPKPPPPPPKPPPRG